MSAASHRSREESSPSEGGKTVALVGCGSQKQSTPAPAEALYTSNYFGLRRDYAQAFADEWGVLSALHGYVEPEDVLEPYDVTFGQDGFDERTLVAHVVHQIESGELELSDGDTVVVLAGKKYVRTVERVFSLLDVRGVDLDVDVETPLQRDEFGGLGDQMGWLKKQIESAESSGGR